MQRVLLFLAALAVCHGANLPSNWPTCKLTDPKYSQCLKTAIQKVLPDLVKGQPKLGVSPIDPLRFESIRIDQGKGPVSIDLHFKNLDVFGTKDVIIESVENDWKSLTANVSIPLLRGKGQYKIDGKVLVLPITGEGTCDLHLENFKANLKFSLKEKKVGSKVYYHVDNLQIDIDCNPLRVQLNNLFNGNKQLGDVMNTFLNENWREIFNELKPAISSAFAEACRQLSNRLFSRVPKNQLNPL
ncbi:JHBP [Nesidiocoris tenuis]|uniref:JHBP n=1 Tax=Nesidiocoris tenuis TaxID=355587 RepID=A0ABN7B3X6_9HEMI|nr:JHBP [Nesidiocoris tenuis]